MPEPPAFIDYANGGAPPSSLSRPSTRPAQFVRESKRPSPPRAILPEAPESPEEESTANAAGVGAGGGRRTNVSNDTYANRFNTQRQGSSQINGFSQANGSSINSAPSSSQSSSRRPTYDGEPIDPMAQTFIKVGSNAHRVDLSNDPQQFSRSGGSSPLQHGTKGADPLAEQMEHPKNVASGSGIVRKNERAGQPTRKGNMDSAAGPSSLPPSSSNASTSSSHGHARSSTNYSTISPETTTTTKEMLL